LASYWGFLEFTGRQLSAGIRAEKFNVSAVVVKKHLNCSFPLKTYAHLQLVYCLQTVISSAQTVETLT
jgi:hypothetical protein